MPSGAKKRRAAKRKKQEEAQTKQTDELTTVSIVKLSIPIEELAKGAVYHEAASVDKKLEGGKVCDKFKDVTADHNAVGENEVSFSKITSNEEKVVSKDEPESGENLKENESLGVECNDIGKVSSDSDEVETAQLTLEENKEFTLLDLESPVVIVQTLSTDGEAVSVEKEMEVANHPMVEVTDVVTTADFNSISENEGNVLPVVKENAPSAEIVFDSDETQVVSTSTVSPATESQVYSACPLPCNPECTVIKETLENLMARVMEFESSMHSLKETLQKALDKLNANSY